MERRNGILSALLAALLFGASTPFAKLALSTADPILVAGLLYLGSGVGLSLLRAALPAAGWRRLESPLSPADLPWLVAAILAGGVAAPVLLLAGLLTTSASTASLLLNFEAVATACFAWLVFRENVDRRIALGLLCILLGGIVLSLPPEGGVSIAGGELLVVAACVCWGLDNNLTRRISGSDPTQIAMWKGLAAGSVNLGLAIAMGAKPPDATVAAGVTFLGFIGFGVSLVLFARALRYLGAARTSAYFSTAPFAGAAIAFVCGQGRLDGMFAVAAVLMAAGVWLHVIERHEHPHIHEATEHEHLHWHDEHHQHQHGPDDPPGEPHSHRHKHPRLEHSHPHYPDTHHQHEHRLRT